MRTDDKVAFSLPSTSAKAKPGWTIRLNRLATQLSRNWAALIGLLLGVYVALPWLAPIFMNLGWSDAASVIYRLYATQCHQLPQRSFFLFGSSPMVSLEEIQIAWRDTNNPMLLRQFIGDPNLGWKVAWSDRMVYMYASLLLFAAFFWPLRTRLRRISWWGVLLLLLPLFVDGFTHMISDVTGGIGGGFRDHNAWLAMLTGDAFPANFYSGDALGSFNSWMRLLTGIPFGLGVVWLALPVLHEAFSAMASQTETRFSESG
jgi:uncharacterized membrane protein